MQAKKRTTTPTKARSMNPASTLNQCIRDYLAECVALGLRPRTVEHYERSLRVLPNACPNTSNGTVHRQSAKR